MTYTAKSCREEAAINDKFGDPIMNDPDLLRAHADALEKLERAEAELAGHARWLDEMVADYRLMADPHTVSKRLAINALIHDQRAELAAERERADTNQEDAERYRWLQSEAKQVYMHPNAEIDNRMRWEFPVLIALTCINSQVSLNAAIDAARRK